MSLKKDKANEEISRCIDEMKDIYSHLISFIDNPDSNAEEEYQNLIQVNSKYNIQRNKEIFNHFIGLVISISNNHCRQNFFFEKIEKILSEYSNSIKANNTNIEIFEQFSSNKRLLYFLIKEKILTIDAEIAHMIESKIEKNGIRYSDFFLFEIPKSDNDRDNENEKMKYYKDHFDEYEANRKAGENDSYICSLIRQDSIEEFVQYVNRENISPSSQIKPSIFETNSFLNDKNPSLIEYAAFYGSIEIFQYLYVNKAEINGSLWLYAIHSNNSDLLVNYIQEYNIKPTDESYEESLKESIKCHHNDFASYIQGNLIDEDQTGNDKMALDERIFEDALKYQNYIFTSKSFNQNYTFFYYCKYNYQYIVDLLIESWKDIIEAKIILSKYFSFLYNSCIQFNEILKINELNYILNKIKEWNFKYKSHCNDISLLNH